MTADHLEPGKLWNSLTEEQKKDVMLAFEESEDDNNLLDNDEVMKKIKSSHTSP